MLVTNSLTNSLTHSLTHSHLVNLSLIIVYSDLSLINSKLVEVVTVENVDDEDRVDNSMLHTW